MRPKNRISLVARSSIVPVTMRRFLGVLFFFAVALCSRGQNVINTATGDRPCRLNIINTVAGGGPFAGPALSADVPGPKNVVKDKLGYLALEAPMQATTDHSNN